MQLKILNTTFCIALISLINVPFCSMTFKTGINYGPFDASTLSRMLLFGNPKFSDNVNSGIIYAVIKFIESINRFSGSIYDYNSKYFYFCFIFSVYFIFLS